MVKGLRAVIFDVDGTLVESVDLHARCWRRAFRYFGVDLGLDVIRDQIGKGGDQLLPVFLSPAQIAAFGDELEHYRSRLWKSTFLPSVGAFPAVRPLFERIRREGLKTAVASSAKADELDAYLDLAHIDHLVDVKVSKDDAERSKPAPDVFQSALDELGVAGDDALAVGDTPWDAIAAARAGIETIGMLGGGWSADELRRAGCFAIYLDPLDLLTRFDDSPLKLRWMYREGTPLSELLP